MPPKPELSVAVCTYNRQQMLADCIQSLFAQSLDPKRYEILIIDNNSSDGTQKLVRDLQGTNRCDLRYIFEPKQGISHARNCAINTAAGKYLAYLDDDEKVLSEWCETIIHSFKTIRPSPDVIGGPTLPFYPQGRAAYFDDAMANTAFFGEKSDFLYKLSEKPEWGFGVGNCAYKLAQLKKYKGFNPLLGRRGKRQFAGEETELFTRMYADGAVFWYEASMIAYHNIPFRRTTLSFQFFSGIDEGISSAIRDQNPLTLKYFLRTLLAIITMPLRLLGFIITKPRTFPKLLVKRLQKEGNHIGYFWQQCRIHIFK